MSHRTQALAALLSLVCAGFIPPAASADAPVSYSFTPGTVVLTTNWRTDDQGVGHFYSILLKPEGCLLREYAFKDVQPQITDTSCHFMSGRSPTLGKTGVFAISVDYAGGSQQIIFRTTPTSVGASLGENPGVPNLLLSGLQSMTSPPPAVDVQATNRWSSATDPSVHQVFHLVTDGFDCRFEMVGQGSTQCVVSSWSDRSMTVLFSGPSLHQADPILSFDVGRPAQGSWGIRQLYFALNSPLKLAVLHHDLQAVNAALSQGKPTDADLDDSLRAALLAGQVDIAKTLVDHGAPLNSATQYQVPVLNLAAGITVHDRTQALDLVKDMVAHGASVTQGGSSSLFYAIGANDPVMVKFLLDHGADANAQTYRGSTKIGAYEEASGNVAILDLLLRHGAKPMAAPPEQNPLEPASQGQYVQGANGAVMVVAPPRQYQYTSGSSQPATQAGPPAVQGSIVLYGGHLEKDGPASGHALLIAGSDCKYRVTRLDAGGATATDYACQLQPGSQPITPGRPGVFVLTLKLPQGPVTLRGMSNDGLWFDMQSASQQPVSLELASRLALVKAPLPVMQLDTDVQPGMHFAIDGFDCAISVAGQGSSRCLLTGWGPLGPGGTSLTSVMVSGDFLRQPDRTVHMDISQGAGGWVVKPAHLYPYTPAMIAAYRGDLRSMDELIAKGADLSSHDPHFDAPLAMALARDHADIAEALIAHGAKLDEFNLAGQTVIESVLTHQWRDPAQPMGLLAQLLDHGADANQPDKLGRRPLYLAVVGGRKDVVGLLLAKGADVNLHSPGFGSPLVAAVSRGDPDMVKLLIDHGADVNEAGEQGVTPLMIATANQHPDIAKLLVAKGADPHAKADLNGHVVDAAALAVMAKQYQAQAAAEAQVNRPLTNQGLPVGALLRFGQGAQGSVTLVGQPGAAGPGETMSVTDVYGGKSASATVRDDGSFAVAVAGAKHDLFMVQMSNAQEVADAAGKRKDLTNGTIPLPQHGPAVYLHGDDPALALTASVVSAGPFTDIVTVAGTYTGPLNVGIQVGGYTAQASDGKFVANDVRLQQGDNAIPIKLTTQGGLIVQQTLKVTGAGHTDIMIGVDPYTGGVAPLKVRFFCHSVMAKENLTSLRFSYLGVGKDDVAMTDAEALNAAAGRAMTHPLEYTYAKPGIYPAKATAVTAAGATVSMQVFVMVQDPAKLDAVLKALWADYLEAFGDGDKAALLQLMDDDARQNLGPAFDKQKDHARDILKGYSPLSGGSFSGGGGVYTLRRDGQTVVVSFSRGTDGVWRVSSIGE